MHKSTAPLLPMTGKQYLDSLRDEREVWIYGQRVKDVTVHPAFRNAARMAARLYDALHDPKTKAVLTCATDTGNGGFTHRFFKAPTSIEDLVAARDAIAAWQRIVYGWMGRAPDFKAAYFGMLGQTAGMYGPFEDNARKWYAKVQEQVLYLNHAVVHPPIDRNKAADEIDDISVRVVKETDAGLIVEGAKVVATNSALTNYSFIAHLGTPISDPKHALVFLVPMNAAGVKLIARPSYEMTAAAMGSPFDYPLSSRLDENDSVLILDKVFIPWEDVLVHGDVDKANSTLVRSGFMHRYSLHGATRLAVKLDFIVGLLLKAVEATGTNDFWGVRASVGEVITWRNLFWALSDALARTPGATLHGAPVPDMGHGSAYRMLGTIAYPRVKEIIEQVVASGLIYVNSHAADFNNPELRPYLDRYIRGSRQMPAEARVKIMKLLWDTVGTEFGGRHELYERNYAGNHEIIRHQALKFADSSGLSARCKQFADECMSEYDLDGWTAPDLVNPDDINIITKANSPEPTVKKKKYAPPLEPVNDLD